MLLFYIVVDDVDLSAVASTAVVSAVAAQCLPAVGCVADVVSGVVFYVAFVDVVLGSVVVAATHIVRWYCCHCPQKKYTHFCNLTLRLCLNKAN